MQIDITVAKKELSAWADVFLSQTHEILKGNSPCPFASPAIKRNVIDFRLGTYDIRADLINLSNNWNDSLEGIVLIYPSNIDPIPFCDAVEYGNTHALRSRGLIALEDHPLVPENIDDLCFNNGMYAIIIIQRADKLSRASAILRNKGYYDNWPADDLAKTVDWRW